MNQVAGTLGPSTGRIPAQLASLGSGQAITLQHWEALTGLSMGTLGLPQGTGEPPLDSEPWSLALEAWVDLQPLPTSLGFLL